jgi:hypothetical protein
MSKSNLTRQTIEPLIAKLRSDTKNYARRKIILAEQQELIAIGQLNFILSPVRYESEHFHFNMLLPRQLMMLTTQQSKYAKKRGRSQGSGYVKV